MFGAKRSAVFTVIFPDNLKFVNDFVQSLNQQSCRQFDVIIANDGILNPKKYFKDLQFKFEIIDVNGSPAKIRELGIAYLEDTSFDFIVFSDSDDLLSPDRLDNCIRLLHDYPIVCNDLDLVDQDGELLVSNYWSTRLDDEFTFNSEFIKDKNILGLGNTAVRRSILKDLPSVPSRLHAPDWFIFSHLIQGREAVFSTKGKTLYRQHHENSIGLHSITSDRLFQIIKVKKQHFEVLIGAGLPLMNELEQLLLLENILNNESVEILKERLNLLNEKGLNYFWWEETNYLV